MPRSKKQKLKLLFILRLLLSTDREHPATVQGIISALAENGIAAERKSIYDDIGALKEFGFEIIHTGGKNAGVYMLPPEGEAGKMADALRI